MAILYDLNKQFVQELAKNENPTLIQHIIEIKDAQYQIVDRLNNMEKKYAFQIEELRKAFPAGDLDAHRRFHESMMVLTEEKRRLRVAIQEKTISGIIWAALVGTGIAIWNQVHTLLLTR